MVLTIKSYHGKQNNEEEHSLSQSSPNDPAASNFASLSGIFSTYSTLTVVTSLIINKNYTKTTIQVVTILFAMAPKILELAT